MPKPLAIAQSVVAIFLYALGRRKSAATPDNEQVSTISMHHGLSHESPLPTELQL